eukprot:scaffold667812_cov64-Prasinocladus_malaysianus.AAC.1
MSATLDASLFADYFGGAPVLNAEGRTFPVTRYFLEDCYEMTGYKMEADSPAALRSAPVVCCISQHAPHGTITPLNSGFKAHTYFR